MLRARRGLVCRPTTKGPDLSLSRELRANLQRQTHAVCDPQIPGQIRGLGCTRPQAREALGQAGSTSRAGGWGRQTPSLQRAG